MVYVLGTSVPADITMAFRLLSYMVQVWEGQVKMPPSRKETGQTLSDPAIVF